jgi:hypothetical protein
MLIEVNKVHPALKHAAYSATTLLPGEDPAAFEKLHRALIDEFTPIGALEEEIVTDMARLTWRKQNLAIFRIAELAREHHNLINHEKAPARINRPGSYTILADYEAEYEEAKRAKYEAAQREGYRAAAEQARQELGDAYKLIEAGEPTTIDGLMKELDIKERLDSLISKCLKQLLMVRGVKSLSVASFSVSTPQISGPRKAG